MGKRRLAWTGPRAAADQSRHARRMMRRAERADAADSSSGEIACKAPDHAHFQHLRRLERRQDRGQAPRQHRFAGARRPDHQDEQPSSLSPKALSMSALGGGFKGWPQHFNL